MRKIFALIVAIVMIAVLAPIATAGAGKRLDQPVTASVAFQRCLDNGNTRMGFKFANPNQTDQKFMVYHRYAGENIGFKQLTLWNDVGTLYVDVQSGRVKEVRVDDYTGARVLFHMDVRALDCPVIS